MRNVVFQLSQGEEELNLQSGVRWSRTMWRQCRAFPQVVLLSKWFYPGPLIPVMFPLLCSSPYPASCLPFPRAAMLPKWRGLAQGSCAFQIPQGDRVQPQHSYSQRMCPVDWASSYHLWYQHLIKEEKCDLVSVLPVSFRCVLDLPARWGAPKVSSQMLFWLT